MHTKSACLHDQIRICHFLKQQLLLLQFTLKSITTEMHLPKPTKLRATQCDSQPKQWNKPDQPQLWHTGLHISWSQCTGRQHVDHKVSPPIHFPQLEFSREFISFFNPRPTKEGNTYISVLTTVTIGITSFSNLIPYGLVLWTCRKDLQHYRNSSVLKGPPKHKREAHTQSTMSALPLVRERSRSGRPYRLRHYDPLQTPVTTSLATNAVCAKSHK